MNGKRLLSLFLAVILAVGILPPVQIFAEDVSVVYLDPVSGDDANAGTEAAPVKTVEKAYEALTAGGTVVFLDTIEVEGKAFPSCEYPVTLTSKTGAEGIITTSSLLVAGDTTFENITLTLNKDSGTVFLCGEGHDLTIGEGVTNVPYGTKRIGLVATKRSSDTGVASPTMTVRSGTWGYIYGTHTQNVTGNVTVIVDGASTPTVSPSYYGDVTGNVSISLKNGSFSRVNLAPAHANGKITGDYSVILGEGAVVTEALAPSGVVEGSVSVSLEGGTVETLTGKSNVSMTMRYGTFTGAESGVGTVNVDIPAEKTLTLSGTLTADNVQSEGILNFEGTGSLTAEAVTGTVNCAVTGEVLKNNVFVTAPEGADFQFPEELGVVCENGQYSIRDLVNFQGLVIRADKNMAMTFYPNHDFDTADTIEPYTQEEDENGIVSYYFPNASGYYGYTAKRTGYYTVHQRIYMSAEEAKAYTVEEVPMDPRAEEGWDHTYYYGQVEEFIEISENDMTEAWHQDIELVTPVFTDSTKETQQMTTQAEMEDFIAELDDDNDNMYVFSIGKSARYGHDIPIVFFTKTDLSACDTLEEVAAALKADGLENVGYKAQMHGDEHAAGEGALNVIYQMDKDENQDLLDKINIYIMPRINPDGAHDCARNLRNQSVLYEVGGNNDPNRHMLTLALHEVRLYLETVKLFDPVAELDGHERQRGSNIADITISSSWRYGSNQAMLDMQVGLVQAMFDELRTEDLSGGWYSSNVNTTPGNNTRSYAAAQGRIHILMESRGIYMGNECYGSRTASHIVCAMTYLEYCAEHAGEMRELVEYERNDQITRGKTYEDSDYVILEADQVTHEEYSVLTEEFNFAKGTKAAYTQVPYIFEPTATRTAPTAYVIPKGLDKEAEILELMQLQEISYYELPANTAILLQQYSGVVSTDERITSGVELTQDQYVSFPNGCYVFRMDQVNAYVLALLMEPDNAQFDLVQQGRITADDNGMFPIYRYIHDLTEDAAGVSYVTASDAPAGITAADATTAGNDGVISGLDADRLYEYKTADGDAYIQVEAGATQITGLTPGTYYVRYQAGETGVVSLDAVCVINCNVTIYLSAANGADTNDGSAEGTAMATLEAAYSKLDEIIGTAGASSTGTIILLDDYAITSTTAVNLPSHTYPVSILGKTADIKLKMMFTIGESTQQLRFHGPTILDNLVLYSGCTKKYDYVFACGNKLVMGENLTTGWASQRPRLVAGDYKTVATDTDLTVKGGDWGAICASSFYKGHTGTAKLTVTGGTATSIWHHYYGDVSGNTEMYVSGMTPTNAMYMNALNDTSSVSNTFSGDITLTLGAGFEGTVYTGARDKGQNTGVSTIVLDGADITKVTLYNGVPETNTTENPVAKGVLVFADGNAAPVEGFDEVRIDTESTVTLTADMTVDMVTGGGTVELNGYSLTGDGAYAMDAAITSVSLRPSAAGMYYTGEFNVSESLEGAVYGIALSTESETPVAEDNSTSLYTEDATSVLVKDIMKEGNTNNRQNAATRVYARAYVKLEDGTTVYGDIVKVTLQQLVTAIDLKWNDLTDTQRTGLKAMYTLFAADMSSWDIPNLKAE